jgi:hypothetical protein
VNRAKKLERALKRNPGNEKQIMEAMSQMVYRRKTPSVPQWSHSQIAVAKLFKEFIGRFDKNVFNSNANTAAEALSALSSKRDQKQYQYNPRTAFTIGERSNLNAKVNS